MTERMTAAEARKWIIKLPWPQSALSSNSTAKLRVKIAAKKKYREAAFWLAKEQKIEPVPRAVLEFSYHQPNNRPRDCQNMPFPLKHAIDGIAQAMGCDDKGFRCRFPDQFSENVKGGCIVVTILAAQGVHVECV